MKIGLIRHFKVNHPFPNKKFLAKSDVINWFKEYDYSGNLHYKAVDLNKINWQHCYSSPMMRATKTANHVFGGPIVEVMELRELDILHQLSDRLRLPFLVWGIIVRLKSFSSNNDTDQFRNGIIAFVDKVISNSEREVLIVSHWFVMRVIRQELIKRGFVGDHFKSNEYGTLYIFESADK